MSYRASAKSMLMVTVAFLVLSVVATAMVVLVDVQPIGQMGTTVGLASLNDAVWKALGANALCDKLSDVVLVLSLLLVVAFGVLGVVQLVQSKSLAKVDRTLWLLLALYVVMLVAYVGCDMVAVNYAPQLDAGQLKPSFPSSHVMCVVAVAVSSAIAVPHLFADERLSKIATVLAVALVVLVLVTRMASGAHWCSDILCGALYGFTMAFAFGTACNYFPVKSGRHAR